MEFSTRRSQFNTDPELQKQIQTITSNIEKISQNVIAMSKMDQQNPQDSQANQLAKIQHYTQQLAKDTSLMLIDLMKIPLRTEQIIIKLTREKLNGEFMATLNAFQDIQRSIAQKAKEDIQKVKAENVKIPGPVTTKQTENTVSVDIKQQTQLTLQSERELHDLEDKEKEMRQLEADITDVNQIFKDLSAMIYEQGTVVSSIESSVEQTTQNVSAGAQQLQQASSYKNNLRKKKVYLTIILMIIFALLMIAFFGH